MNYASILKCDTANGEGFRVTLYTCGCKRNCKGCFNPQAQNPNYGKKFDEKAKAKIFSELEKDYCRGLSILGGEPMSVLSDNREAVLALLKEVKTRYPSKDIWMWTGYTIEELQTNPITRECLKYIDVLIDGPYNEEKKDLSLPYRGSSNQRMIRLTSR